ncbi:MAG: hypothetical protein ISS71_03980 [Phycisphaerae bacterium]|nr:hypothetical protein [Phycisphaerae bacterium]
MTTAQDFAYRFRRWILSVGIIFTVAGFVWVILPFFNNMLGRSGDDEAFWGLIGTPLAFFQFAGKSELCYLLDLAFVVGLLLVAQWVFLRPGKDWKVRLLTEGRPLKTSIFTAAMMSMLLTTGGIALLLELPDWWQSIQGDEDDMIRPLLILGVMAILWLVWAWIFWVYWKQTDRYTQLGKMIRGLVAGSILEVMVAVPVHIWATRQRECYCCRGTYTTLVLAGTVLVWAFGPGIILLYWREKYRREKLIQQNPPEIENTAGEGISPTIETPTKE